MRKTVSQKTVSNRVLSTLLWSTLIITTGISVSACSGGEQEIKAVDRVDQAADIARQLAPEAKDLEFPEVAPTPVVEVDTADAEVVADDTDAVVAAESEDLAVNVGAEIYNKQCMACHANGLLNAPKYGDAAAWAPRIEKGVETLTMHSAQGFNQMPAQAYNDVTEDQIRQAVEYMIAAAS